MPGGRQIRLGDALERASQFAQSIADRDQTIEVRHANFAPSSQGRGKSDHLATVSSGSREQGREIRHPDFALRGADIPVCHFCFLRFGCGVRVLTWQAGKPAPRKAENQKPSAKSEKQTP